MHDVVCISGLEQPAGEMLERFEMHLVAGYLTFSLTGSAFEMASVVPEKRHEHPYRGECNSISRSVA